MGRAPPVPLWGPGKGKSPEGFWALQMVRQTFYSTVISRGKVLCARRGERPEVQRADLRGRGFFLHTSARGAEADCWGRVGKEIFRGPRAVGSRLHPCPRPTLRQQLVVRCRPGLRVGRGSLAIVEGGVEEGGRVTGGGHDVGWVDGSGAGLRVI